MLSSRDAYKDELLKIAITNKKIICIEADLGGHDHPFAKHLPEQFINVGIAELAGIDIAAGLEEAGFIPFFSTFAAFAVLRATEGIKLNMGYMNRNIKVVCPYGGVAGGWFGTTHHCLEDYGIIGMIPNIKIACPHGESETRSVIRNAANTPMPFYIRLSRNDIFESINSQKMEQGSENVIVWEKNINYKFEYCIVSVGEKATELCKKIHAEYHIPHAHLIYIDAVSLNKSINELKTVSKIFIVVEEHRPVGSVAANISLLDNNLKVFSINCGQKWPSHGGTHDDVLDELDFNYANLVKIIDNLPSKIF